MEDEDEYGYVEDGDRDLLAPEPIEIDDEAWYEKWAPTRYQLLLIASIPIALGPLIGAMYIPVISDMQKDLNTTEELGALTLSLYSLVSGVAPLVYGTTSDQFGRKPVYIAALGLFCGACFMAAGVLEIYSFLFIRMMMAAGMAGFGVAATGMIADVFPSKGRGKALALSVLPALIAPILGPVLGGALAEFASWRYCFFIMAVISFPLLLIFVIKVPETRKPTNWKSFTNPFRPLAFMLFPAIAIPSLCRSLLFALMYTMIWSVPIVVEDQGGGALEAGLLLLPYGIFTIVGSLTGGKATDWASKKWGHGGHLVPFAVSVAACLIGAVIYGWMIESHKLIAVIGTCIIGWALTFGRPGIYSFTIEEKPREAGAVTSCLSTIKFLTITVEISLAPTLKKSLGIGWLMMIYSIVLLVSAIPTTYIMYRNIERQQEKEKDLYTFVG